MGLSQSLKGDDRLSHELLRASLSSARTNRDLKTWKEDRGSRVSRSLVVLSMIWSGEWLNSRSHKRELAPSLSIYAEKGHRRTLQSTNYIQFRESNSCSLPLWMIFSGMRSRPNNSRNSLQNKGGHLSGIDIAPVLTTTRSRRPLSATTRPAIGSGSEGCRRPSSKVQVTKILGWDRWSSSDRFAGVP